MFDNFAKIKYISKHLEIKEIPGSADLSYPSYFAVRLIGSTICRWSLLHGLCMHIICGL